MQLNVGQGSNNIVLSKGSLGDGRAFELQWNEKLKVVIGNEYDAEGKLCATHLMPRYIRGAEHNARIFYKKLPLAALKILDATFRSDGPDMQLESYSIDRKKISARSPGNFELQHIKQKSYRKHRGGHNIDQGIARRRIKKINW